MDDNAFLFGWVMYCVGVLSAAIPLTFIPDDLRYYLGGFIIAASIILIIAGVRLKK